MKRAKVFESPLISHARMRALFRGLVEVRALSARLDPARAFTRGLEACWVATAIDLHAGDLVSVAQAPALIEHLRWLGLRLGLQSPRKGDIRRALADSPTLFSGTEADRLLCAVGAATALQAAHAGSVAVAYLDAGALKAADWLRAGRIAVDARRPLLIVLLPGARTTPGSLHTSLRQAGLPLIPVDAADPVALYRVAQESLGRARAGGGPAAIECIATGADPIRLLGSQLVEKRICTERWIGSVEPAFRKLLPLSARRTRSA